MREGKQVNPSQFSFLPTNHRFQQENVGFASKGRRGSCQQPQVSIPSLPPSSSDTVLHPWQHTYTLDNPSRTLWPISHPGDPPIPSVTHLHPWQHTHTFDNPYHALQPISHPRRPTRTLSDATAPLATHPHP